MSTSTEKGNKYEIEVKKHLEAEGWEVFRQHRKPLFINGRMMMVGADIFDCDLVARRKGDGPLWISVSVEGKQSEKMKKLLNHAWHIAEYPEVWVRVHGRKVFRRFVLNRDHDTRDARPFNEAPEVNL